MVSLISALISGCRSKILGYEITMFKTRDKNKDVTWSQIALKAQELDKMLGHEENDERSNAQIYRVCMQCNMKRRDVIIVIALITLFPDVLKRVNLDIK